MIDQLVSSAWSILDERGEQAVSFTSFLGMDCRNEGDALSYPVEEGGFVNYNKVQRPVGINVKLGVQGSEADFEQVLLRLEEFQRGAVTLSVGTPAHLYPNMTLTGCTYTRDREGGAAMLLLDLSFTEVREPVRQPGGIISSPKNATSFSQVNIGKIQPLVESALLVKARGLLGSAARKMDPLLQTARLASGKINWR